MTCIGCTQGQPWRDSLVDAGGLEHPLVYWSYVPEAEPVLCGPKYALDAGLRPKSSLLLYHTCHMCMICNICRLEKINWDKASGKAKVTGTLLSLGGAMVLTLYKGPNLISWNTHLNLVNHGNHHGGLARTHPHMVVGACSALGSITFYALWMILQVPQTIFD